jgi:Sap, sulfolipid-1-addressing protein
VSTEALALALVSIVRPTTAAAVWAMLMARRPRRLLTTYLLAGMAVSLTIGIAAVLLADGVPALRVSRSTHGILVVALGVVALLLSVAAGLGLMHRFRPAAPASAQRQRTLSPAGAATAGVVTHLPGVFYLAALGAIAGTGAAVTGAVLQVVVYNLVWFSPAIVALGACLFGPIPPADRLAGAVRWGQAHEDAIVAVSLAVVGVWLVAKGVSALA